MATAHCDAIFFEDPAVEIEDYFSDWDELSDDFYDDDATVQRRQRGADLLKGGEKNGRGQTSESNKDGTDKTQHGKTDDWALKPDLNSFQSVVWRQTDHDKNPVQILEPGDGEKVALLKNWREVFKNSHPSFGRSRMRKQRVMDYLASEDAAPARSGPVHGLLEDEKNTRESSMDRTSGMSLENLHETDVASGGLSNTSPEKSVSPPFAHSEKVEKPPAASKSNDSKGDTARTMSSSPAKNRKRKATDENPDQNGSPQDDVKQPKSKRVAAKKVGQDTQPAPDQSGSVRRSGRQTRSQK